MSQGRDYLGGLAHIGKLGTLEEQRATWRQSLATLASQVASQRPVPLEGLSPEGLLESARVALRQGLVDDVGFLSPPAAAAALYELASALPSGEEKRDLGRRVLKRLHQGDAPTFVALATRLALSSRRALSGPPIRARVALSLDLPIGAGARADALALALISRRDMEREWLTQPSTGSLASRRLAARLLERAAREAARRAAQGDDSGVRVFGTGSVQAAWARLLGDRESLVWRHVATARGLLSHARGDFAEEIERDLEPGLSPTEWRRAAASLAARIAVAPSSAVGSARALLDGEIPLADAGVVGAMMLGLPRAAEAEPEAVEELLTDLVRRGGIDAMEGLVDLRRERLGEELGAWASERARAKLRESIDAHSSGDDGRIALMEALHADLAAGTGDPHGATTLPERIGEALAAFTEKGALAAYEQAQELLDVADGTLGTLLLSREDDSMGRRHAFRALRELDLALLEKSTLSDLLMLGASAEGGGGPSDALADLFGRLNDWLVAQERDPIASSGHVEHLTIRLRRMRAMLHLVDSDGGDTSDVRRGRALGTARMLLRRVELDAETPLRRIVCATAARACDALVRLEICEVSDVLVAAGLHVHGERDLTTFAEASMVPDIEACVRAYASLGDVASRVAAGGAGERACLDGMLGVARELPVASSPRVEALRAALHALVRALEAVASAGSLGELAEGTEGTLLAPLEAAVESLARLVAGARRRLGADQLDAPAVGAAVRMLDFCVERALRGSRDALGAAVESASEALHADLPRLVADAIFIPLERLPDLPEEAPRRTRVSFVPQAPAEAPLPGWLPPSRILGGFYVLRPLGSGALGSVFVARRAEERHDEEAECFALKVPEYDGAAARTLSEAEFLDHFRQEAGALLSLPSHHNLANFVTFDSGARPKPILVMELVEGPSLERAVEMNDMDLPRAFEILQGIGEGLRWMHRLGVGHLDVKPSNIILRDPDGVAGPMPPGEPVLVDFGLAGRHIRPGCATGEYGAPEIWGSLGRDAQPSPLPADIYAFGCVAYEVLTGRTLFEAPNEMALIATHVSHDGRPPGVAALMEHPDTENIGNLLFQALRADPKDRATIDVMRRGLAQVAGALVDRAWPLVPP